MIMRQILLIFLIVSVDAAHAHIDDQSTFRGIRWGDSSSNHDLAGEYSGRHLAALRQNETTEFFGLSLTSARRPDWGFVYSFDRKFGFYGAIAAISAGVTDEAIARATEEISKAFGHQPVITPVGKKPHHQVGGAEDPIADHRV